MGEMADFTTDEGMHALGLHHAGRCGELGGPCPYCEEEGMTERQKQAAIRRTHRLPYRCECGGVMDYAVSFGRVWSHCKKCTPVTRIDLNRLGRQS